MNEKERNRISEKYKKYDEYFDPDYQKIINRKMQENVKSFVQSKAIIQLGESQICRYCKQNSVLTFTEQRRALDEGGTNIKICLSCNRNN